MFPKTTVCLNSDIPDVRGLRSSEQVSSCVELDLLYGNQFTVENNQLFERYRGMGNANFSKGIK